MASRHNVFFRNLVESQRLCIDVLDAAIGSLPPLPSSSEESPIDGVPQGKPEGQVSQLLGVFDLRGLTPACIDFEFITFLIEVIYKYIPRTLV